MEELYKEIEQINNEAKKSRPDRDEAVKEAVKMICADFETKMKEAAHDGLASALIYEFKFDDRIKIQNWFLLELIRRGNLLSSLRDYLNPFSVYMREPERGCYKVYASLRKKNNMEDEENQEQTHSRGPDNYSRNHAQSKKKEDKVQHSWDSDTEEMDFDVSNIPDYLKTNNGPQNRERKSNTDRRYKPRQNRERRNKP